MRERERKRRERGRENRGEVYHARKLALTTKSKLWPILESMREKRAQLADNASDVNRKH